MDFIAEFYSCLVLLRKLWWVAQKQQKEAGRATLLYKVVNETQRRVYINCGTLLIRRWAVEWKIVDCVKIGKFKLLLNCYIMYTLNLCNDRINKLHYFIFIYIIF